MKKVHFGVMLFLFGGTGYLILSLYLASHQVNYNGMTGTYAALLGNELLVPYIIFCAIGIIGILICVYEIYLRNVISLRSLFKQTDSIFKRNDDFKF